MPDNRHYGAPRMRGTTPFACPLCGREVFTYNRTGAVVEHMKPRTGPLPEGCEASNHRPSVVAKMEANATPMDRAWDAR